jgi:hypothetical protein
VEHEHYISCLQMLLISIETTMYILEVFMQNFLLNSENQKIKKELSMVNFTI